MSKISNSDSRGVKEVPDRHTVPNAIDGAATAGTANHGPKGPARPVRGRVWTISCCNACCWGVISSSRGPEKRDGNCVGKKIVFLPLLFGVVVLVVLLLLLLLLL